MARPVRIEEPGGYYHVYRRAEEGVTLFRDAADYNEFLSYLEVVSRRWQWNILGYALCDTVYHITFQTPTGLVSRPMQWLNQTYAAYRSEDEVYAKLFKERYRSIIVEDMADIARLVRYAHRVPVQEGTTRSAASYKWSSYAAYAGRKAAPDWLDTKPVLGALPKNVDFKTFTKDTSDEPLKDIRGGSVLGSKKWADNRLKVTIGGKQSVKNAPKMTLSAAEKKRGKALVDTIVDAAASEFKVDAKEIRKKSATTAADARLAALLVATEVTPLSNSAIGSQFGKIDDATVASALRRVRQRMTESKAFTKSVDRIRKAAG